MARDLASSLLQQVNYPRIGNVEFLSVTLAYRDYLLTSLYLRQAPTCAGAGDR